MNTQSVKSAAAKMLTAGAMLGVAPLAYGTDAGNFVWNGGFEESYIYWANGIGNSNPYGLRYSEYGDINGIEARLEHWTGTGGIADKDASTAPKPNDTSLCSGERYLTIYKLQYVEQTLELPAAGTYEVSFRHCMRSGNSGHKIAVSLIDGTETAVFSSGDVSPGNSAGTYTGTATIAAAGRYRLRFEGKVNAASITCIDDVAMALKDAASPFGAVDLKLPRYDRALLKVRPLDYGQGDDLTQVDYRIAKHGQPFVPDWTAISAGLAKETEFAYLVTGLEIDTEYDLEVRFSAAGESFVVAKSFRTTKELLIDGGFDELPDFLSVSASLYKSVADCNDCPWFGTGEVANRARASTSGTSIIVPSTTYAKGLITSNVYAYIHTTKDLKQSITVPTNGSYKVSFKYAASPNYSQDHSTAVEVMSEGGVTNTLFVESIENGDYALHQCEREVTLPAGNMTFQLRGIPPADIGIATCYDDISLQLVEANVNPALSLSTSGESIDRVTLDLNLSAIGAPDAIVDIAIAFAPTNQPIGDYYEPILSGLSAPGIYTATIAGLDMNVTYACRLRVRNNSGGEAFVNGTFSTPASIIGNGGFEEGSSIASGNVGDLYDNNGVWPATTTVWKVNAVKAVYNNGISKPNTYFTPNANFTLGGYSGFIWKEGSFEQDIIVPLTCRYRLGFRYGLASNYKPSINIEVNIAQNGVTNTVWSTNGVNSTVTQFVPDNTIANLVQGPATFTIKQTINSTASTSGCYDDITLMPPAKEWTNEVVVVSQNPAVTGGMTPLPRVYVDPAAGWAQTFSADGTWTDPSTGDKYTCTGWKLYRNGALVDQKASLNCAYVHPAGADDRIVWGWKPWAPSDKLLGGQGFFIRVF